MKILKFEVDDLLQRAGTTTATFHEDLNILTGKNGAGKTSILKLLWYVMSGNILLALQEIAFKKVYLVTDKYECTVYRLTRNTCKIEFTMGSKTLVFEDERDNDGDMIHNAEDRPNEILVQNGSSVFFPTFRRIEGGFTLNPRRPASGIITTRQKAEVEDALIALSKKLTNDPHVFVSAMSTVDIVSLLLRQHSEMSEESNVLQQSASQEIIQTIKDYKSDNADVNSASTANRVLDQIRNKIESLDYEREKIMMPLEAVRVLVARLFQHVGITINNRLSFGEAANAVNSDELSAGEKQMLSFICYNAFYKNSVIFIDEPELSLHVDWQRQLFPILLRQQSSNQFIIATHSPFIYTKYPEKEISIDSDRGDRESQ
jgi:predicted ATP-binding protein involved in virulence